MQGIVGRRGGDVSDVHTQLPSYIAFVHWVGTEISCGDCLESMVQRKGGVRIWRVYIAFVRSVRTLLAEIAFVSHVGCDCILRSYLAFVHCVRTLRSYIAFAHCLGKLGAEIVWRAWGGRRESYVSGVCILCSYITFVHCVHDCISVGDKIISVGTEFLWECKFNSPLH